MKIDLGKGVTKRVETEVSKDRGIIQRWQETHTVAYAHSHMQSQERGFSKQLLVKDSIEKVSRPKQQAQTQRKTA